MLGANWSLAAFWFQVYSATFYLYLVTVVGSGRFCRYTANPNHLLCVNRNLLISIIYYFANTGAA